MSKILTTRPPSEGKNLLRNKFAESIAGQSELMDKLGQQLITLDLESSGLYATVLKFTQGDAATAAHNRSIAHNPKGDRRRGWFVCHFIRTYARVI